MKDNLDRYPRSADSSEHWKFKVLRREYDWAGEGKFWALNDRIAKAKGCILDLTNPKKRKELAACLDFTLEEFNQYLTYLEHECELIIRSGETITTQTLKETLDFVNGNRKKDREKKNVSRGKNEMSPGDKPNIPGENEVVPVMSPGDNEQKKIKENKGNTVSPNGDTPEPEVPAADAGQNPDPIIEPAATITLKDYNAIPAKDNRSIYDFLKDHRPGFIEPYVDYWNIFAQKFHLPAVVKVTESRRRKFRVRIREQPFDFPEILRKAKTSDFALGGKWFTFDWLMENETNYLKVLEGNYETREQTQDHEQREDYAKRRAELEAKSKAVG